MKIPEKIYVDHHSFNDELDEFWYTEPNKYRKSVEYIRKDVVDGMLEMSSRPSKRDIKREILIEKACKFIKEHHHEYSFWNTEEYELEFNTQKFIDDFRKYIKGE